MTLYSIFGILGAVALVVTAIRYFLSKPSSIIVSFFQNFVGIVFIFSGFIKANDTLGFGYKLEEYYDVFAQDTQSIHFLSAFFLWLKGSAVFQSILICIVEMLLGFVLLLGARKKLTLWLLSLMIIFFTFLTFYSANYNKVTDCGCFGDFMHITPWTSFTKDLILLVSIFILVFGRKHISPLLTSRPENISVGIFTLIAIIFPVYTWSHLPVFDFRPYKVGTNIIEAMKIPPGGEGKFETLLYYKNLKSGEVKEFTQKNYPWQDTLNWKYDTAVTKTIVAPVLAPIHDFTITSADGSEYTEDILNHKGPQFFLVCRDLSETNRKVFGQVNDFAELCAKDSIPFMALTSSSEQVDAFKKETASKFDFFI